MKSHSKNNDLVRNRFNNLNIKDVINNNLSLQTIQRTLARDYNIKECNSDYFLGPIFKVKFSKLDEENKIKVCRLLASMRSRELMEQLSK